MCNACLYTCQVTRFRRVAPGNRACHPHFPEHLSGHGFHYDDPESPRIGPDIRKNYLFGKYRDFTYRKDNNPESFNCFYNKNVKSFLQNVYWKEEVLIRAYSSCSSSAKRKKYLCKYQKAWEAEFSWLSHSGRSVNDAYCILCKSHLSIGSGAKNDLTRHAKSQNHMQLEMVQRKSKSM